MVDMIETIESAIRSVTGFETIPIYWEDVSGVPFGDSSTKFPFISVSNERPNVENMLINGAIRVVYPVQISIKYKSTEEKRSKEREEELIGYEKMARGIVYNIGLAHTNGDTSCEIVEDSIAQRATSGSATEVCESTISFNLAFDEEDY